MNEWLNAAALLGAGIIGYALAVRRDRTLAIRSRKIKAIIQLNERVLEIARTELSDGQRATLHVPIEGGIDARSELSLADISRQFSEKAARWKSAINDEENRARLWLDSRTVSLVALYSMLMMQCQMWEHLGRGSLIEDKYFLYTLRLMFGNTTKTLKEIVTPHSKTGEPQYVNCLLLSAKCLRVIQYRVTLEITCPYCFRVMSLWWRFREWRYRKERPRR